MGVKISGRIMFDNNNMPNMEEIITKMKDYSGLNVGYDDDTIDTMYDLVCEGFSPVTIYKDPQSTSYCVETMTSPIYLEEVLYAVLLDMGGKPVDYNYDYPVDIKLQKWARTKWKDRKWWQFITK